MKTMLEEEEGTAGSKVWDRTVMEMERQCSLPLAASRPPCGKSSVQVKASVSELNICILFYLVNFASIKIFTPSL